MIETDVQRSDAVPAVVAAKPKTPSLTAPRAIGTIVAVLCAAQLLLIVDVVVVNVALPSIVRGLGITDSQVQLASVAYTLVFGSLLIVSGRLGDLLGRRRLLLGGVLLFTVASLLSGAAQQGWQLFAARACQGLGAALISPNALALLTSLIPEGDRRNQAFGVWAAVGSGGAILGQLLGGALTELAGWRWIFLINVPIGVVIFLAAARWLPESRAWTRTRSEVLSAAAFIACLVGLLRNTSVLTGNVVLLLNAGALTATLLFASLYLQIGLGYSPLEVGAGFAPVTLIVLAVSPLAGRALSRVGARTMLLLGGASAAVGMLYLARAPEFGSYVLDILPGLALVALGSGLSYAPTFALGTSGVSETEHGLASGLLGTAQELGAAIGVALLTALALSVAGVAQQGFTAGGLEVYRVGFTGAVVAQVLATIAAVSGARRSR